MISERNMIPAPNQAMQPAWAEYEPEPERRGVALSHYLWLLRRHRWRILAFIFGCAVITVIVSSRLTRVYEATTTVDVDRQIPTEVIGQDSTRLPLNDADQFLATQVKLIQSDAVLRPVALKYNLLELEHQTSGLTPEKKAAAEEAPVKLKKLKVTRPPNTFLLLISYRSPNSSLAAGVANAIAKSYVEHTYSIRFRSSAALSSFMERQLEELKAKMERSSAALAHFERELNVIGPEEKTTILSARLLQLNTEYTNAQADRVQKEAAWKAVQGGSVEAAQVSTQGETLKVLAEKLDAARQQFADVKTHYGAGHPEYRKAAVQVETIERQFRAATENVARRIGVEYREALSREAMLQKTVNQTKAEFDRLNARSFEYQALKHEAEADKNLYEELVRKIKEASINSGFQNSSIRIADEARAPVKAVFPDIPLNLALALLFSTIIAVGAAVLSDVLDKSIRDPEHTATLYGTEVVGSLPMVKTWRRGRIPASSKQAGVTALVRRADESTWTEREQMLAGFEEAIRTVRNAILLGSYRHRMKSLMVTSSTPSEGKTTTSVHLAIAHAQQKHKTLLIDGDLRHPEVHSLLGIRTDSGLSTVLQNGLLWREGVTKLEELPDLDVLPSGHSSRRCADLIGNCLPRILEEAAADYDLVIIDSPPMLGFPEPLQMAAAVDGVVLIAKARATNRDAVELALTALQRVRANVVGLVLNEVTKDASDGYYYYYHYGNYYRHYGRKGA
jgi:capsular exopolysaccharide synthesis family protein